jgi:hypothetical protein
MATKLFPSQFSFVPVDSPAADDSISTATTITVPNDATGIMLQAFTEDVYYTLDGGTTATSSNGFLLGTNDGVLRLDLYPGASISVISASGEIRYHFFRTTDFNSLL